MSHAVKVMLAWSLSPVGTLLNTGLLAVVLLLWGADPGRLAFWLAIALFLVVSGSLDLRAYVLQRRLGMSSYEVAGAVLERMWQPWRNERS